MWQFIIFVSAVGRDQVTLMIQLKWPDHLFLSHYSWDYDPKIKWPGHLIKWPKNEVLSHDPNAVVTQIE